VDERRRKQGIKGSLVCTRTFILLFFQVILNLQNSDLAGIFQETPRQKLSDTPLLLLLASIDGGVSPILPGTSLLFKVAGWIPDTPSLHKIAGQCYLNDGCGFVGGASHPKSVLDAHCVIIT
jgi:hypothetical protein